MDLDGSNYVAGSGFAETSLGGESITVETDGEGFIVAGLSNESAFLSHPIDNRGAWTSSDYKQAWQR